MTHTTHLLDLLIPHPVDVLTTHPFDLLISWNVGNFETGLHGVSTHSNNHTNNHNHTHSNSAYALRFGGFGVGFVGSSLIDADKRKLAYVYRTLISHAIKVPNLT